MRTRRYRRKKLTPTQIILGRKSEKATMHVRILSTGIAREFERFDDYNPDSLNDLEEFVDSEFKPVVERAQNLSKAYEDSFKWSKKKKETKS